MFGQWHSFNKVVQSSVAFLGAQQQSMTSEQLSARADFDIGNCTLVPGILSRTGVSSTIYRATIYLPIILFVHAPLLDPKENC